MKVISLLSEKYLDNAAVRILTDEDIVIYFDPFSFLSVLKEMQRGIVLCDEALFRELFNMGGLTSVIQNKQIMLTVICEKTSSREKIRLLENGVDNIWSYDIQAQELLARIKACQRFLASFSNVGDAEEPAHQLLIDAHKKTVMLDGQEVLLTASEFLILNHMFAHPKRIYAREELMALMKTSGEENTVRVIDTHIKNLRKKIEKNPAEPRFIKTVHGRGYRFEPNDDL